jgi:hypothetical protein
MARRWILISGVLCLAAFLATLPVPRVDGHVAGSDGLYYFSILRSSVLDHDLDLRNDYALLGAPVYPPTALGRPGAPFSVGTPILWAPFFLLAHAASLLLATAGAARAPNGIGGLYEPFVCIGTILYAFAGLWLTFRTVARELDDTFAAACAALAMWWATSLVEYTVAEPSMSHGASFFAIALFLAVWRRPGARPTAGHMAAVGAAAGLVALVRSQEGLVVLLPAIALVAGVLRGRLSPGRGVVAAAALGGAFALVFLPQVGFWHAVYGSWLTVPQGSDFMRWGSPVPGLILFSRRHGLLLWHPVLLIALLGLVPLARRDRALALAVGGYFLAQLYVNSVVSQWWAGDAFGGRRFMGVLPLLALPLAAAAAQAARSRGRGFVIAALAVLVAWNGLSFVQYRLGMISRTDMPTWRQLTLDRIELPFTIARRVLHR